MRINICSKKIKLTENLAEYIENNFSKLEKYINSQSEIKVVVTDSKERKKLEVTIMQTNGPIVRAEEIEEDIYIAVDKVYQKLYKQLERYSIRKKEKIQVNELIEEIEEETIENKMSIERVKRFNLKPMSMEEAILQMELIGHSFYMFRNQETFEINVAYKRKNGGYGIIEQE
ncbi:ribosome hibernation-promoting factor, HPF/YfiA family [Romboutsia sp.]|uniref:ribosome hibernation-promoting factor, HPF/YfiA family n=1 Tax=Romboutsia sp. TaxID=1965302 RepID=UPI003F3EB9E4